MGQLEGSGIGISNKDYAAVATSSLAVAALVMGIIHAGYASANAKAAAVAEAEALAARVTAEEEASELQVSPAVITDMSAAQAAVESIVSNYGENVAVSVRMLDGSGNFDINGNESMQSASMIKLLVLAEYLDELDSGAIAADDSYELAYADVVGGSGTMQDDAVGTRYTLDEVARRMIAVSDNVGTNVLIERMGVEQVGKGRRAGASQHADRAQADDQRERRKMEHDQRERRCQNPHARSGRHACFR